MGVVENWTDTIYWYEENTGIFCAWVVRFKETLQVKIELGILGDIIRVRRAGRVPKSCRNKRTSSIVSVCLQPVIISRIF